MLLYDELEIRSSLTRLGVRQRTLFSVLCAERVAPAYVNYCSATPGFDASDLDGVLDALWKDIASEDVASSEIDRLFQWCLRFIPGDDEGDSSRAFWFACAAVGTAAAALVARQSSRIEDALRTSRAAYGLIEAYFGEPARARDGSPAASATGEIETEVEMQRRDLRDLRALHDGSIAPEAVDAFRRRSRSEANRRLNVVA